MSDRVGDPPIHKFFTPEEIAEIDALTADPTPQEGDTTTMSFETHVAHTVRPDASREERLAALPPLPGVAGNPAYERVLGRLADTALGKLAEVDAALTEVGDLFEDRFAADDARAATRDRIASTAKDHRLKSRR
ncbi:hypothetical protein [Microbacterium lacticum]